MFGCAVPHRFCTVASRLAPRHERRWYHCVDATTMRTCAWLRTHRLVGASLGRGWGNGRFRLAAGDGYLYAHTSARAAGRARLCTGANTDSDADDGSRRADSACRDLGRRSPDSAPRAIDRGSSRARHGGRLRPADDCRQRTEANRVGAPRSGRRERRRHARRTECSVGLRARRLAAARTVAGFQFSESGLSRWPVLRSHGLGAFLQLRGWPLQHRRHHRGDSLFF